MKQLAWLKADLPFDQEDANRYLPWIIAVMACLTAFLAAVGLTLGGIFLDYHAEFENRLQIQVPPVNTDEDVRAALVTQLKRIEGVAEVKPVDDEALYQMLEPWVGSRETLDLLPVPTLVEVWMEPEAARKGAISAERLKDKLAGAFPGVTVDDYRQWVADFNAITGKIRQCLYAVAGLMLVAAVTVVLLITRASVQLHFDVVRLLHRVGAEDGYITHQFQAHAAWLTLKGALLGVILAMLLFIPTLHFIRGFDLPLIPDPSLAPSHIVFFILLPLLMTAIVAGVTYLSVQAMLTRLH